MAEGAQFCTRCGTRVDAGQPNAPQADTAQNVKENTGNTALILGIVGLALTFIISIVGLILCIIAITTGNKERKILPTEKAGKATAGMILGIIGLGLFVVSVVIAGFAMSAFF